MLENLREILEKFWSFYQSKKVAILLNPLAANGHKGPRKTKRLDEAACTNCKLFQLGYYVDATGKGKNLNNHTQKYSGTCTLRSLYWAVIFPIDVAHRGSLLVLCCHLRFTIKFFTRQLTVKEIVL